MRLSVQLVTCLLLRVHKLVTYFLGYGINGWGIAVRFPVWTRDEAENYWSCTDTFPVASSSARVSFIFTSALLQLQLRIQFYTCCLIQKKVYNFIMFPSTFSVVGPENNVVFVWFLLGNYPASEFYMPTFRNTLFHLHRRIGMRNLPRRNHTTVRIRRMFQIKKSCIYL